MTAIQDEDRAVLPGSMSPQAKVLQDTGELPAGTSLRGMTITFVPSALQQADLDTLLAAQQDASSPLYHQWLTPEQFGARFGMTDADLAKVESWLRAQGFSVDSVARARNRITFSGTADAVTNAFRAPLHTYRDGAEVQFSPSTDLSLPSAFAGTVAGIGNLSSFRPQPHVRMRTPGSFDAASPDPRFTSSQSGSHFLTPKDIATIYDITPAYSAGFNGSGQSIAVMGQSSVLTTDITAFQTALGNTAVAPTYVLVPNSGTPVVKSGDEAESDLDLEYTSGIAPGATIQFVYVGNNASYSVFDSIAYAIGERIAPIISISYGKCEPAVSASQGATLNALLAQAATQGQTVISAAGDSGSTDCYLFTSVSTTTQQALAVDFPASSPYVTAMGGTEFSSANATSSSYWSSATNGDVIGSALSYIPEQVWNDDSSSGTLSLSATGGGASILYTRPTWQTGVPGIPSGSARLLPDVSLLSSPVNVPYLYCSSDSSSGVNGSCANGFRDINSATLTTAGGTSFAAPIFAGMMAILNQKQNSTGQGLVNPTLYSLAGNSTTYASVFHDITIGTNGCPSGTTGCTAAAAGSYAATAGYDQASGLGSFDFYKLLTAWPTSAANSRTRSAITLSAASTTPAVSTADAITINVASTLSSVSTVPTGTLALTVDGVTSSLPLANGSATYSFSSATPGTHTIVATYSGDATYTSSTATLVITVGTPPNTAAFSIAVKNITVTAGSSGSSTVTVTSSNGYSGTVGFVVAARSTGVVNICYSIANVAVSAATSPNTTLTIYTSTASCSTVPTKRTPALLSSPTLTAQNDSHRGLPGKMQLEAVLAGTFGVFLLGLRTRRMRPLLAGVVLIGLGAGLSGCGSGSSSASSTSTTNATAAKGTFTFTLTGTDTTSSSLNNSTNFTVTVN